MNLSTITKPNTKGQIVIPKKFREELSIDETVYLNVTLKGNGVFISPLGKTPSTLDSRKISLEVLKKTAGSWGGDGWEETDKKRREIELLASKRRKKAW